MTSGLRPRADGNVPTKMIQERGADQKIMQRLSGRTAPQKLDTENEAPVADDAAPLAKELAVANAEIDRLKARLKGRESSAGKAGGGTKTTEMKMDPLAGVVDDLSSRNAALLEDRDRLIKEVDRLNAKLIDQTATTDGNAGDPGRLVDIRSVVREDDDFFLVHGMTELATGQRTPTTIEMSVEAYRRFRRLKPESKGD